MQEHSYQVKAVLEQQDAKNKIFLSFKDNPGNPLGLNSKDISPSLNVAKLANTNRSQHNSGQD